MERLYLPPSLRYLEPLRIIPREPMAHTNFIYDLVEALRPRLVVDVGTGAGAALSLVCQSMRDHDVDGTVYGIDPWEDDEARPEDDPRRWAALNAFLRAYFRGVYYLLKTECADGARHFANGSIDVLRLDATRAGARLGSLLEIWMPRLSPGGVVLCVGINDPERSDLAEDWRKATTDDESFSFPHGTGLGVLRRAAMGTETPKSELLELLFSSDESDREGLVRFYEHADRHHAIRAEIHSKWTDAPRKKQA